MNNSKIEWCDKTWNPVTGCLHNCEYCYAAGISKRFNSSKGGKILNISLDEMAKHTKGHDIYHIAFQPTFHCYRLDEPQKLKKPSNIFVCSMADLFGEWVPDEWIKQVFEACEKAPQHNYLFLTKNPKRYSKLRDNGLLPKNKIFWYGTTITKDNDLAFMDIRFNHFLSVEPILEKIEFSHKEMEENIKWLIVGTETGNRKEKVIPKREWIENIVKQCKKYDTPLFMKNNLSKIWGEELIKQFPKGLQNDLSMRN